MCWAAHLLPAPWAAAGWGPLIPSPGSRYGAKDRAGSRCWQSLHMLSKLDLLLLHCLVLKRETGLACGSCFYYSLPAFYKMTRAERARGVRKHRWEFVCLCWLSSFSSRARSGSCPPLSCSVRLSHLLHHPAPTPARLGAV